MFSNTEMEIQNLPKFEASIENPLSEKYRPTNIIATIVFYGVLALIVTVVRFQPFWTLPDNLIAAYSYTLLALLAITVISVFYHYLADPLKTYVLREQDVSYSSGLIFRKTVNQPILRIQHIELKRGPIERMVGLATLQVFSAGGTMHTFEIPGLEQDTAQNMRQFILEHKDLNQHG